MQNLKNNDFLVEFVWKYRFFSVASGLANKNPKYFLVDLVAIEKKGEFLHFFQRKEKDCSQQLCQVVSKRRFLV